MYQQPRVSEFNRHQVESYTKVRKMLAKGSIPAGLLNPILIQEHNACNPPVAHITHPGQEVNLHSLAVLYGADGVETRKFFKAMLQPSQPSRGADDDLEIRHDPKSAKIHATLDELED